MMSAGDNGAGGEATPQLVVTSGAEAGRRLTLEVPAILGRGEEATVVIDEPEVSRRHAEIRFEGDHYVLEDLGSRNGTRVAGEPVRGPTRLAFGAMITLGTQLELLFTEPEHGQEEALRRQRLETVSRLVASVARDIGDKLCAAKASLDYLRSLPEDESLGAQEVLECLEDLGTSLSDSMELLPHLHAIEQRRPQRDRVADVSRIVRDLVAFVGRSFFPAVEVASNIEAGLQVKGDSAELYHVLLQLCVVVRDEMGGAGRIFLGARKKPLSRFDRKRARVVLTVRAGEAVPPASSSTPSTRRGGDLGGGGLRPAPGLESIHEVVTLHGGRLRQDGRGKTAAFHVELASMEVTRSVRTYDSLAAVAGPAVLRRGVVVVAHDEKVVRRSLARVLGAAGVEAVSCRRADVLRELERREVQVVVLEDGPATDAGDLLVAVGQAQPAAKVVLMAGRGIRRRPGMAAVIRPPWTADSVVAAVERHLEV